MGNVLDLWEGDVILNDYRGKVQCRFSPHIRIESWMIIKTECSQRTYVVDITNLGIIFEGVTKIVWHGLPETMPTVYGSCPYVLALEELKKKSDRGRRMTETELKPCPFCGKKPTVCRAYTHGLPPTPRELYMWYGGITCCDVEFTTHNYFQTKEEAVEDITKAWNNRAGEPKRVCGNCKHFTPVEYEKYGHCINDYGWQMDPCQKACDEWERKE